MNTDRIVTLSEPKHRVYYYVAKEVRNADGTRTLNHPISATFESEEEVRSEYERIADPDSHMVQVTSFDREDER